MIRAERRGGWRERGEYPGAGNTCLQVFRLEVVRNLRLARWWFLTASTLSLTALSVPGFLQDFAFQEEQYQRAKRELEESLAASQQLSQLQQIEVEVVKRPSLALYLDYAQARHIPDAATFNLIEERPALHFTRRTISFEVLPRFIDWGFLCRYLLSLAALLLAHDAVAGELDSGVLKLALATSISRSAYLAGKLFAILLCLCLPLVGAFLLFLSLVSLWGFRFPVLDLKALAAGVLITAILLLFLSLAGLSISILSRSSSKALIWVLILWTSGVFFIPSFARLAGQWLSRPQVTSEYERRLREARQVLLRRGNDERAMEKLRRSLHSLRQHRREQLFSQVMTSRRLARLSPFSLHDEALSVLADSGQESHQRFLQDLEAYMQRLRQLSQAGPNTGVGGLRENLFFTPSVPGAATRTAAALGLMWPLLLVSGVLFFTTFLSFARLQL